MNLIGDCTLGFEKSIIMSSRDAVPWKLEWGERIEFWKCSVMWLTGRCYLPAGTTQISLESQGVVTCAWIFTLGKLRQEAQDQDQPGQHIKTFCQGRRQGEEEGRRGGADETFQVQWGIWHIHSWALWWGLVSLIVAWHLVISQWCLLSLSEQIPNQQGGTL